MELLFYREHRHTLYSPKPPRGPVLALLCCLVFLGPQTGVRICKSRIPSSTKRAGVDSSAARTADLPVFRETSHRAAADERLRVLGSCVARLRVTSSSLRFRSVRGISKSLIFDVSLAGFHNNPFLRNSFQRFSEPLDELA